MIITKVAQRDERLARLVDLLIRYTELDFSERAVIGEHGDEVDAFAAGLNTMGDELQASLKKEKAYREEIRRLNAALETTVKQRTAELVESRSKYRDLFEYNPLPLWIIDACTFRFLRVNESSVRLYGYTTAEFLSLTALDLRPQEERERFLKRARPENTVPQSAGLWQHIKKDGTVIKVEIHSSAVNFEGKKARLVLINEVTEREEVKKRLETALHRSKHAQEIAHVGHWEADLVMGKSYWSDESFRIYGYEPGTVAASYDLFLKSIHPDDFASVKAITDQAMQDFKPFTYYHRIVTPAGTVKYLLASGEFEFDGNGKPVRLFGVAQDVTELKEKEKLLIESETRSRNFSRHLNQVLEDERSSLAREIHDELGQQLVGIKLGILSLKNGDEQRNERLISLSRSVEETIQSMRKIATELRPGILDSLGLIPSLKWLAEEFERKTQVPCSFKARVSQEKFDSKISTNFFRICQEALTNISKHAQAKKVKIEVLQNKNRLTLKISDNGKGISGEGQKNPFSMGLLGMRERAMIIGATLQISGRPKKGTMISLERTNL